MAEEQVDDRRASLEAAFDKAEQEQNDNQEPATSDQEAASAEPPRTDGTPPEPGVETEVEPAKPGQEAPSEPEQSLGDQAPEAATEPAAEPPATDYAVPVGWRGEAKQEWSKLPSKVQEEVVKREKEIGGALREAAESRQFQQQFNEVVRPFESIIAAQGSDPLTATRNLMQTGAALTIGTPIQKAQTVANIIQSYGVDLEQLAQVIDGQPAEGAPGNGSGGLDPAVQNYLQQQLAPVQEFIGTWRQTQQQQEQQMVQELSSEMDAFAADPKNLYFEDVRDTMADLMEVAAKQGKPLSLDQAYRHACMMDPNISAKFQQTQQLSQAGEQQTAAERRAAAASSIAPRAQPVTPAEPKDRLEAINQAWDKHAQGG